jgi:hypothetical protein
MTINVDDPSKLIGFILYLPQIVRLKRILG